MLTWYRVLKSSSRYMSTAPAFKPFRIALIQLGNIGPSKDDNLRHVQDMLRNAAKPADGVKPNLIVLPVRRECSFECTDKL